MALVLVAITALTLGLRVVATLALGYNDAEALTACYALHPQPAYVHEPGMVGVLAGLLGGSTVPSPRLAHGVTTLLSFLFPPMVAATALLLHACRASALAAALAVTAVPAVSLGLFGLRSDLPLALSWMGTLAGYGTALLAPPASLLAFVGFLAGGLALGAALASKVSAIPLFLAVALTLARREARPHWRTSGPWFSLLLVVIVTGPLMMWTVRRGFPWPRPYLESPTGDAPSLGLTLWRLLGGPWVALSPLFVFSAYYVAKDMVRPRQRDLVDHLLGAVTLLSGVLLFLGGLWFREGDPLWLLPVFLGLPLHYARRRSAKEAVLSRPLAYAAVVSSLVLSAFGYGWLLFPWRPEPLTKADGVPWTRAVESRGWPGVIGSLHQTLARMEKQGVALESLVVVGAHWSICAQIHAALPSTLPMGCASDAPSDFDLWFPRAFWAHKDTIVLVTDQRFEGPWSQRFPHHVLDSSQTLSLKQGGKVVRTFKVMVWTRPSSSL